MAAQAALDVALTDLSDAVAHGPSLLPGWSVGHVLTHIAAPDADSVVWRLEGAARGELRDQYPGGLEQRRPPTSRLAQRGRPPCWCATCG